MTMIKKPSGQPSVPKKAQKGKPEKPKKEEKKVEEDPKPQPQQKKVVQMDPDIQKKRDSKRIGKLQQAQRVELKNASKPRSWQFDGPSGL